MANTKDVLMASPIGEEILEYGKREGRSEGIAEGRSEGRSEGIAEGKREGLRASVESLAEAKFPGALEPGFAQRLVTFEALEAMFREMLGTDDPNRVSRTLARLAEAGR
jgi:flagellar biosynthesis/type III secretory pathway protein FliH